MRRYNLGLTCVKILYVHFFGATNKERLNNDLAGNKYQEDTTITKYNVNSVPGAHSIGESKTDVVHYYLGHALVSSSRLNVVERL